MKRMKSKLPFAPIFLLLALLSCSGEGKKGVTDAQGVPDGGATGVAAEQGEDKYYHPILDSEDGIEARLLNGAWSKILIMTADKIKEYDKAKLYPDMVVGMTKDINNDGIAERIVTGTYLDKEGKEGSFLSVIGAGNKVILTDLVSDEPRLVNMRDAGAAIFFGAGYGSEYFKQISCGVPVIEVSGIPSE